MLAQKGGSQAELTHCREGGCSHFLLESGKASSLSPAKG